MKVIDILTEAYALCGGGAPSELIKKAAVGFTNTILSDIGAESVCSLTDPIPTLQRGGKILLEIGIAMLISILLGDDAGASEFNDVYNNLKKKYLSCTDTVRNTLFGGEPCAN